MKIYIICEPIRFKSFKDWAAEQGARAVHFEAATEAWVFCSNGHFPFAAFPAVFPKPLKFFAATTRGIMMEITPLPHLPSDRLPSLDQINIDAAKTNDDLATLAGRLAAGTITADAYEREEFAGADEIDLGRLRKDETQVPYRWDVAPALHASCRSCRRRPDGFGLSGISSSSPW